MMKRAAILALVCATRFAPAVPAAVELDAVPFESPRWVWSGGERRVEEHLGRPSLYLRGGKGWIGDADVQDGIVEFDLAFSGQRGFCGGVFRLLDDANYEHFYLRPHQSGNPDANQYNPVFHGHAAWQLYAGDGYSAPTPYPTGAWIRVRIAFAGDRGEVFIGDMTTPAVAIHRLERPVGPGKVGISVAAFAPAWFSGFRFASVPGLALASAAVTPPADPPGTVRRWHVSTAFPEETLAGLDELPAAVDSGRAWSTLETGPGGIANLARVEDGPRGDDTALARIRIHAAEARTVRFRFGYSDRVRVYLDGRILYSGDNGYRTRDYRYLGTIGPFDAVHLRLAPGDHALTLAVSESFGGWGLLGILDPTPGVEILDGAVGDGRTMAGTAEGREP